MLAATPARFSVQIGRTGSAVCMLVVCRPRAQLASLGNFRCTSAIQKIRGLLIFAKALHSDLLLPHKMRCTLYRSSQG